MIKALSSTLLQVDETLNAKALEVQAEWVATQEAPISGSNSTVAPPDSVCNQIMYFCSWALPFLVLIRPSTPQCLLKLYDVHYAANAQNGAKVSFGSFLTEYARYNDLATFEATQATYAVGQSFNVVQFNGGLNDQNGTEVSSIFISMFIHR